MAEIELLEKIELLKVKAVEPPFPKKKIDLAQRYSEQIFSNKQELFLTLCSLNLLNAAIKMSFYRKILNYKMIKTSVSKLLILLVSPSQQKKYEIKLYIDSKRTAYITIFNLQFSFHQIPLNNSIANYIGSGNNIRMEWERITLQMVAEELFDLAMSLEI